MVLSQDYLLYQAVTSTLKAGPFPRGHEHGHPCPVTESLQ